MAVANERIYNHLLYGIRERKGFVQITGEVGAGKTTLCRALLEEISDAFTTALILNPALDADLLIKAICMEYGLQVKGMDRLEMMAELNAFLLDQLANNRTLVASLPIATEMVPEARATMMGFNQASHASGRIIGSLIALPLFGVDRLWLVALAGCVSVGVAIVFAWKATRP